MYIFDKNVFLALGHYYPKRFPTIWKRIDELADIGTLRSVREVRIEIETNCPFEHITEWVSKNHNIFMIPTEAELHTVREIFQKEQYRGFVRKQNIIRGLPVADPFIIAAGKFYGACVITQESRKSGARIPFLCDELKILCKNLEGFLEQEELMY
ncbi:MAG: DUF4411 family protein [Dehalococcoidales bacterium]